MVTIITQDHEGGTAKGSLDPLHVLPSNLKEMITTPVVDPMDLNFVHIYNFVFFTTKKRKRKILVCYNGSRQNNHSL